jgi:beta-glucosidase
VQPVIQGSGSATTHPTRLDIPLERLQALVEEGTRVEHCDPVGADAIDAAVAAARRADAVIVFANSEVSGDGERADRTSLALAPGQDALIAALAAANARTIVVLATPDAVVMPWAEDVGAILATFYAGQGMGDAVARTLLGFNNPAGKLTTTFPQRIEDIPGWLTYPGEAGRHIYSEGVFVGYRGYDARRRAAVPVRLWPQLYKLCL